MARRGRGPAFSGISQMIAILGGLGAALGFAGATLLNARATRLIAAPTLLAWVMLIGLALTLPVALADRPDELGADDLALLDG
jgi:drug/metabolite transporter (DMT)-like permease